jgi:molybdenum cofactor cytidylyltransferase
VTRARCDWGVILARGESVRMGRPKGLCRLPGDTSTFLASICELYGRAGLPVAVVTRPDLASLYRAETCGICVDEWVLLDRGGGTAASCLAAVASLAERATHLWFHPVDLPLVTDETLARLRAVSSEVPGAVLVPWHGAHRGHPVVTPVSPWRDLSSADHPGAMKTLIEDHDVPVRRVPLQDPGIHQDFDRPEDLIE